MEARGKGVKRILMVPDKVREILREISLPRKALGV